MNFELPKIYPITDVSLAKLSHLEQVERLVEGGARFIQLREKSAPAKDFYEAAKKVVEFARPLKIKIIINDRVDIALALKADGVHLGQDDLPPQMARKILGEKAIIGFSTHSAEQALEATRLPIDYAAIGAVFQTSSKEKPEAILGIEGVEKTRQAIGNFPLVAIGGINFENASAVFRSGADSIALIGAILNPPHLISENIKKFRRLCR
jgi:thiamine-phosphate pyrophosphorylase